MWIDIGAERKLCGPMWTNSLITLFASIYYNRKNIATPQEKYQKKCTVPVYFITMRLTVLKKPFTGKKESLQFHRNVEF